MPPPVEVVFNLELGQGDALNKMVTQFEALAKQFGGAMRIRAIAGAGPGVGTAGARGTQAAIGRLVRGIPGGGLAMAFKSMGMVGGISVAALSILGFVKKIFQNSRVLQTITGTFWKTLGAMADIMLMPVMPLFVKVLRWMIQTGFPIAKNMGEFFAERLGGAAEVLGDVSDVGGGIQKAFQGIKEFDWSKIWEGMKEAGLALWDIGKRIGPLIGKALKFMFLSMPLAVWNEMKRVWTIGTWVVKKLKEVNWSGIGTAIWNGIKGAAGFAKDVFATAGGWIWNGLFAVLSNAADTFKWAGKQIWDGLFNVLSGAADLFKWLGKQIWEGLKSMIPGAGILGSIGNFLLPGSPFGGGGATPAPAAAGVGGGSTTIVTINGMELAGAQAAMVVEALAGEEAIDQYLRTEM